MHLVGLALSHLNPWSVLVAGYEFALEMEHSTGFHVVNWGLQDAVDQKHSCDALCNQKGPPE